MGLYRFFFRHKYRCPVCGRHYFDEIGRYEICPVCGWEKDKVQERFIGMRGGANKLSLAEAREMFRETGTSDPNMAKM